MGESAWTHLGIVAVPAIMLLAMWLDGKKSQREQQENNSERHQIAEKLATDRHTENVARLSAIETKIDPVWRWWNKSSNGGN